LKKPTKPSNATTCLLPQPGDAPGDPMVEQTLRHRRRRAGQRVPEPIANPNRPLQAPCTKLLVLGGNYTNHCTSHCTDGRPITLVTGCMGRAGRGGCCWPNSKTLHCRCTLTADHRTAKSTRSLNALMGNYTDCRRTDDQRTALTTGHTIDTINQALASSNFAHPTLNVSWAAVWPPLLCARLHGAEHTAATRQRDTGYVPCWLRRKSAKLATQVHVATNTAS
jgi:hypothetical protein